jgi:hypothetical protein
MSSAPEYAPPAGAAPFRMIFFQRRVYGDYDGLMSEDDGASADQADE